MAGGEHNELIRREFAKQAPTFEDARYSFGDRRLMGWILSNVPVERDSLALDVAAGTGHLARAVAEKARLVIALDLSPDMLAVGKAEAESSGIRNVVFERGDAASLPYLDGSFDLVVTRFSIHHFEGPARQLGEMVRVCKPGGRVAVVDLVVAEEEPGDVLNELERMRDPSHTSALRAEQLGDLLESASARIVHRTHHDQALDVERWLAQAEPPSEIADQIRARLTEEVEGGAATGMRPFEKDGSLKMVQRWAIIVGQATS